MNAQAVCIVVLSWLLGSTVAALLLWFNAKTRLVYATFIAVGLLSGCAYDWAYGIAGSVPGWIMLAICSLLWLQGAWLVTTVLPRWFAPARPRRASKPPSEFGASQCKTH